MESFGDYVSNSSDGADGTHQQRCKTWPRILIAVAMCAGQLHYSVVPSGPGLSLLGRGHRHVEHHHPRRPSRPDRTNSLNCGSCFVRTTVRTSFLCLCLPPFLPSCFLHFRVILVIVSLHFIKGSCDVQMLSAAQSWPLLSYPTHFEKAASGLVWRHTSSMCPLTGY